MTGSTGAWPLDGEPVTEQFRSSSSRSLAVVWWGLSAAALLDLAVRGRDHLALAVGLGIVASDMLLWLGAWRPAVLLFRDHVVLRGSVRDRSLTLAAVTSATATGPLLIWSGERRFASPAVGSTVRQRRRVARQAAAPPPGFGGGRIGGRFGARGALPGPGAGFDDSRMDPATRDALARRTPGAYAAERITEDASRRRTAAGLSTAAAAAGLETGVRWVPAPAAATALLVLVVVLVAAG